MYRPEPSMLEGFPLVLSYEQQCERSYSRWLAYTWICLGVIARSLSDLTGRDVIELEWALDALPLEMHYQLDSPNGWKAMARAAVGAAADDYKVAVH